MSLHYLAELEEQQQHYQEQHNTQQQTSTEVQAQVSECVAAVKADDSAREQNIGTLTTGKNEESLPLYRRIVQKKNPPFDCPRKTCSNKKKNILAGKK